MARVRLTTARRRAVTEVSDIFIDEFMNDANEVQLKLYLYLLRHSAGDEGLDISGMADALNFSERDIMRALKYWEKQKVLKVTLSGEGKKADTEALEGISLLDLSGVTVNQMTNGTEKKEDKAKVAEAAENREFSAAEINEFAENEDSRILITAAEMYFGRPVGTGELRSIMYMVKRLKMNPSLVDYLMQRSLERGIKKFSEMEKIASRWKEAGVSDVASARAFEASDGLLPDDREKAVCAQLGRKKNITQGELDAVRRWTVTFGFSDDIIAEACRRTVMNVEDHRFSYADSILNDWFHNGVRSMEDIEKLDELYKDRTASNKSTGANRPKNTQGRTQNRYKAKSREYDYDELEKKLMK